MFIHAFALGAYSVPLPTVMKANGLGDYISIPYILSAIAALVSPLVFGSLADRKYAPERLLGVIVFGAAILMSLASLALYYKMGAGWYLVAMGAYHFWAAPGWGLLTAIGLGNVTDPQREFAPLRVWATIGFMGGAAFVSLGLGFDRSPFAGFVAVAFFLLESIYCLTLPATRPPVSASPRRIRDYFGWDAIQLFKESDHRMVFICSALYNIPLVAFYPYTLLHLDSLGVEHPSGVISIAQLSEIVGMMGLAAIMGRWRLKWLILAGMIAGLTRYLLYCTDSLLFVKIGIAIHGLVFIFFSMTTQIYLEKRVDHHLRNQAQALLVVMTTGVGGLSGYVFGAWWYKQCMVDGTENWPRFWGVLSGMIAALAIYFLMGYRGKKGGEKISAPEISNPV